MSKQRYLLPILALAAANILWGINTPLIKMGVESIPAPIFMAIRFLAASLILLPFALHSWQRLGRKDLGVLSLASCIYVTISGLALNTGLTMTSAINAGVIWLLGPIVLVILSVAFLNERLSAKTVVGIVIGIIGSLLIVGTPWHSDQDATREIIGNLLVVVSVIGAAVATIIFKPYTKKTSPTQAAFMSMFPGTVPIALLALLLVPNWSPETMSTSSTIGLVASIVVVIVANVFFFYALRFKKVQKTGAYQYLDPLAAVVAAWIILAERPGPYFFVGTAIVIVGIYIVETRRQMPKIIPEK